MKKIVLVITLTLSIFLASCAADDEVVDKDTTAPVLVGVVDLEIEFGSTFDYMLGVTASDDTDGDITGSITIVGTVGVNTAGTYVITYTVTDAANNETEESRIITVAEEVTFETDWIGIDMVVIEDETGVSITYTNISTDGWFNKSAQLSYDEFNGETSAVILTFIGEADQMYFFRVEGPGGNAGLGMTTNGEEQSLTIPLDTLDAAAIAQINLLSVFAQTGGASGTIIITNIEYVTPVVLETGAWNGFGMEITVDGDLTTITYSATSAEWWNSSAQYPIADFDGTKEAIEFIFTGELGHEYLFKIEGGGTATELAVTGTGVAQSLLIPLNQYTEAQRDGFNLLVLFSQTEGAAGTIILSPWVYPSVELPTWNVYGEVLLTENATSDIFDYTNTPTNWWENNAQQALDSFDGSKTAIVFNFTGEEGHVYLFKIEGGGVFTELAVTATGSLQEFILPLDSLTEAQRDGLNLIVWFCQTEGASGSIEIDYWEYVTD